MHISVHHDQLLLNFVGQSSAYIPEFTIWDAENQLNEAFISIETPQASAKASNA